MKSYSKQWSEARDIAKIAHAGQKDKSGCEYFGHVSRVASRFGRHINAIVGLLHDVIEDSDWTLDQLCTQGFDTEVVEAVEALTRRKGEEYMAYIERCSGNPHAIHVKIADLEDNMDILRLPEITDKDVARLRKYHKAYLYLKSKTK